MRSATKLTSDIFAMDFDIVIPLSGSIIAVLTGIALFLLRYLTYTSKRRKYEKRERRAAIAEAARGANAAEPAAVAAGDSAADGAISARASGSSEPAELCDAAIEALLLRAIDGQGSGVSADRAMDVRFAEEMRAALRIAAAPES